MGLLSLSRIEVVPTLKCCNLTKYNDVISDFTFISCWSYDAQIFMHSLSSSQAHPKPILQLFNNFPVIFIHYAIIKHNWTSLNFISIQKLFTHLLFGYNVIVLPISSMMIKHINKYKVKYGSEICESHIRNLVKKKRTKKVWQNSFVVCYENW